MQFHHSNRRGIQRVRTPIRWAGSKRLLLPTLVRLAPSSYKRYVEPFAGSAALFFALGPKRALLGDVNEELISFYRVLATRPGDVARAITRFADDGGDYYSVRAARPSDRTSHQAAARCLYLNRFCFNGV